jgi:hypothetical protein
LLPAFVLFETPAIAGVSSFYASNGSILDFKKKYANGLMFAC